jgi:hypothetical protein
MPPSRDPTVPERTGILVVRVWVEHNDAGRLRARLTQAADLGEEATTRAVASGVPGICDAVEAWLRQFLESAER